MQEKSLCSHLWAEYIEEIQTDKEEREGGKGYKMGGGGVGGWEFSQSQLFTN